ncbi:hypothetical protein ACOME3_002522 [Neoechinorhynchus agilis]
MSPPPMTPSGGVLRVYGLRKSRCGGNIVRVLPRNVLKRIRRGARYKAAKRFTYLLTDCIETNSELSWMRLFAFPRLVFPLHASYVRSVPMSLTSAETQIGRWLDAFLQVKGAVHLLSSMDSLAKYNEEILRALRSKHPSNGGRQYFDVSSSFDTVPYVLDIMISWQN